MQKNTPKERIPYFAIDSPYHFVYRKESTKYPVGPHTHNAAEIYLTLTDLPDVLLDDTVSAVPAGSVILIPPFCVHQLYHEADVVYERYILSIHHEWLSQILFQNLTAFSYLRADKKPFILQLDPALQASLTVAFADALQTECGASTDAVCKLFSVLRILDACLADTQTSEEKKLAISAAQMHVNEMISYIHAHLQENLTLSDLASHFYLHPDYLSRLFKAHTHTSVGHYIAIQKITRAQVLLRSGCSIAQVQEQLGYSSYAHFAKTFKKLTGLTPGQYKNP